MGNRHGACHDGGPCFVFPLARVNCVHKFTENGNRSYPRHNCSSLLAMLFIGYAATTAGKEKPMGPWREIPGWFYDEMKLSHGEEGNKPGISNISHYSIDYYI